METMEKVKLNLGSGDKPLDGYENLDSKTGDEIYPLGIPSETIDEIRASHVLEHFSRLNTFKVLQHWVSKLKVGGVLKIAVPDFAIIADQYSKSLRQQAADVDVAGFIMGGQTDENDFHKAIFDRGGLEKAFRLLGLTDVKTWKSEIKDCASLPISLNLQGTKTDVVKKDDEFEWGMSVLEERLHPAFEGFVDSAKNVYSQYGEDGVVDAIFEKIGTENKWCLEVGAADGILFSNTRRLIENGWHGILIEQDGEQYEKLVENCEKFQSVDLLKSSLSNNFTLEMALIHCNAPKDIDLVCIDIDGQDYHVWNQLLKFRPRVVMIEYNPELADGDFIPAIGGPGQAGINDIMKLAVSKNYHSIIVSPVNAICIRDDVAELILKNEFEEKKTEKSEEDKDIKTAAIISMPRLCFADNIFSDIAAFKPLGIDLERGVGVFWGQVLSRMITEHLTDGTEFIITCDYDTYFTKNQVHRLLQLMVENPDADAICPLQMKRESDTMLIEKLEPDGSHSKIIRLDADLVPVDSAHFGLTIFRAASFAKLQKPWFMGVPNAEGEWGDGRQDEDVFFWNNFKKCGLKLFLAHQIGIGHLQLMCTVPGRAENHWKPEHIYMNDVHADGLPEWCDPPITLKK